MNLRVIISGKSQLMKSGGEHVKCVIDRRFVL